MIYNRLKRISANLFAVFCLCLAAQLTTTAPVLAFEKTETGSFLVAQANTPQSKAEERARKKAERARKKAERKRKRQQQQRAKQQQRQQQKKAQQQRRQQQKRAQQQRRQQQKAQQERRRKQKAQQERRRKQAAERKRQQQQQRAQQRKKQQQQKAAQEQRRKQAEERKRRRQEQKRAQQRKKQQQQKAAQERRRKQAEERKRKQQQRAQQRQKQKQPAAAQQTRQQKADERKAKREERQRAKQEQRQQRANERKAKSDERQRAKQEQRQQKADEREAKKAANQAKKQERSRLQSLRERAQQRQKRERQRSRLAAKERRKLERQEQRIKQAEQRRRNRLAREARRNKAQTARLERRRNQLRQRLQAEPNRRAAQRERRQRRLQRQRAWEQRQARRDRRGLRRDFGFFRGSRVLRRNDDRVIFAALAGVAVGAAATALFVQSNDDPRFGWQARDFYVEPVGGGWTRTVVVRPDGSRVITIRDSSGFLVRRYREFPDDRRVFYFNNQPSWWDDEEIYVDVEPVNVQIPRERYVVEPSYAPVEAIYEAATSPPVEELDRTYTLNQVLVNSRLRDYMPRIDLDTITFASGSSEVPLAEVDKLETIGVAIEKAIKENPGEVYLIEGHTDAVGTDVANVELSDKRASAVADILTSYFSVPPENLVTQGYGERYLKVKTSSSEQANRRVAIRRITPLLSKSKDEVAFDDQGNEVFSN